MFWRNKKVTVCQIIMPILCCLLVLYFQSVAEDYANVFRETPDEHPLSKLPKCFGDDCVTVGFGIVGDSPDPKNAEYDWIFHTMKYFAEANGLKYDQDVKLLTLGTPRDFKEYLDDN